MNDKTKQALELASEELQFFHMAGLARLQTLEAITALRTAIEQAEKQEPVAYVYEREIDGFGLRKDVKFLKPVEVGSDLYTSPPASKPWVGLTDEEIISMSRYDLEYAALIGEVQRKLKEKNA